MSAIQTRRSTPAPLRPGRGSPAAAGRLGFTLIELLVVFAVISILLGLTLATLGRARDRARQTECVSQLHQIGIAIQIYISENNNLLPNAARLGADPAYGLPSLRDCLSANLDHARIFHCPGDQPPNCLFTDLGTSYEWNTFVSGRRVTQPTMTIIGLRVDAPLMGDAEDFHGKRRRNALFVDGRVVTNPEIRIQ